MGLYGGWGLYGGCVVVGPMEDGCVGGLVPSMSLGVVLSVFLGRNKQGTRPRPTDI